MTKKRLYTLLAIIIAAGVIGGIFAFRTKPVPEQLTDNNNEAPRQQIETGDNEKEIYGEFSIPAFAEMNYNGRELKLGRKVSDNESYSRYEIAYLSGELKITGIMNVPKGPGPHPALVLNHGYIDPSVYTTGRGLRREQDYLARRGYAVLHPDYRNHAGSDKDQDSEKTLRFGYVQDVINAVLALKNSELNFLDKENIGMLGHSMGGGITQNVLVMKPELVKAAVLFAPVSADQRDNYERWLSRRPEIAKYITDKYGLPEDNPMFWDGISSIKFIDRIKAPVMIHHGTGDKDVPIEWSRRFAEALENAGKKVTYYEYAGEPHEFARSWALVMERTVGFFDSILKK